LNNWIEISAERLTANFLAIQAMAGVETTVLAVIKANAYGHGAETCAPILIRAGATWLGVTCASEGARVRKTLRAEDLDAEILVMCGFLSEDAAAIAEFGLTPVVWTREQVEWLRPYAGTRIHVEVDTGMGRQGVAEEDFPRFIGVAGAAGLVVEGVFTHFSSAEVANSARNEGQKRGFESVLGCFGALGLKPRWVHAGNTSAIDNPGADAGWIARLAASVGARAMVRPGLALYGYALPIEGAGMSHLRGALRPVMTWKAHVLAVRELAAGDTVGYSATFTAERPMRVALLPVGYADGLRRELSSTNERPGGWVTIRGQRAAILGRISMNLTVVDVTGIAGEVCAGDEAVVLGDGVTADDHAGLAGTIAYEILCGIHPCG
jgi:alanine racemase